METKREISATVLRNVAKRKEQEREGLSGAMQDDTKKPAMGNRLQDSVLDHMVDIREYDVPYVMRVAIDNEFFVGLWYNVSIVEGDVQIQQRADLTAAWGRAEPRVLAFDIECTKEPLKFPDANIDSIYMISYMVDGEGFLIVNREIVTEDIDDFEYTPKKEYEGPFTCINVANEYELIRTWLDHVKELKPLVVRPCTAPNTPASLR
jgi:DNA polymerase epsilon subunit 1